MNYYSKLPSNAQRFIVIDPARITPDDTVGILRVAVADGKMYVESFDRVTPQGRRIVDAEIEDEA